MKTPKPISLFQLKGMVQEYLAGRKRVCGGIIYDAECDCDIPEGKTLEEAIRHATMSLDKSGKKCPHQRRVAPAALQELHRELTLQLEHIDGCTTFAALHDIISSAASRIRGVGALTVYDVAVRIGCFKKLKPEMVYLHAGTREGAQNLGLDYKKPTLAVDHTLPEPLRKLAPAHMEDFLCIYKSKLGPITAE